MKTYSIVSPYPVIEYLNLKTTCSKYRLTFYLVEEGMVKFVKVLLPMLLISTINTINVLMDVSLMNRQDSSSDDIDSSDRYLQISAALALTAVFVLPEMTRKWNTQSVITWNEVYILIIFVALSLSSIPPAMVGTTEYAFVGMILLWGSFCIPIFNLVSYLYVKNSIKAQRIKIIKEHEDKHLLEEKPIHPFLKKNSQDNWPPSEIKKDLEKQEEELKKFRFVTDIFSDEDPESHPSFR